LNLRDRVLAVPLPFGGLPVGSHSPEFAYDLPFFCLSVSGRKLAPSASEATPLRVLESLRQGLITRTGQIIAARTAARRLTYTVPKS